MENIPLRTVQTGEQGGACTEHRQLKVELSVYHMTERSTKEPHDQVSSRSTFPFQTNPFFYTESESIRNHYFHHIHDKYYKYFHQQLTFSNLVTNQHTHWLLLLFLLFCFFFFLKKGKCSVLIPLSEEHPTQIRSAHCRTAGQLWLNCSLKEQIISISKVGGNQSSLRKVQRRNTMTYPLRDRNPYIYPVHQPPGPHEQSQTRAYKQTWRKLE